LPEPESSLFVERQNTNYADSPSPKKSILKKSEQKYRSHSKRISFSEVDEVKVIQKGTPIKHPAKETKENLTELMKRVERTTQMAQ
jgi:hypothetical protein